MIAVPGEDAGHAGVERLAVAQLEDARPGRPGIVQHRPLRQRLHDGAAHQSVVGVLGERLARQDAAHLSDQRPVQRHLLQLVFQHRLHMSRQRLARVGVFVAREARCEIGAHPLLDQSGVERALPAEDQVDLQRLVQEIRLLEMRAHLLLQPRQQPRQQQPVQRAVIRIDRRRAQLRALVEAEGQGDRCRLRPIGIAAARRPQGLQRGQDGGQIGVLWAALDQLGVLPLVTQRRSSCASAIIRRLPK